MANITDLPIEVLLRIFQCYLQTESQRALLNSIGKVCVAWKNICLDRSLWTKYDGTPTFKKMEYLIKKGVLRNTKELILSSIENLNKTIKETEDSMGNESVDHTLSSSGKSKKIVNEAELFQNVQNVEAISFSQVQKLSNETLSIVGQNCTKLKEIKIGKKKGDLNVLNYKTLVDFFSIRGCGIKKIDFSYCKMSTFTRSMRCISDCCPNLEYLHLMNNICTPEIFPTGYVQIHCSKLKSLYLDHNIKIDPSRHPSGFPDLEEFVYVDEKGFIFNDKHFECILFNSPKLKFLSLNNCQISASAMLSLPACSVEYLYIPRSKACSDQSLSDLLKKWSHSLKQIDVSYNIGYVEHAILKLIKTPVESPLEFLNLTSTPVKVDLVEEIVKSCVHLQTLKLEACRNLMRGMKRTYSSKLELEELTEKINSYRSTQSPDVLTLND